MKRPYRLPLFAGLLACLSMGAAGADDKSVFEIDGLKSAVPVSWKMEKPKIRLRYAQFRLPKAEGDSADADLAVFRGISGTTEQNITRWKGQFLPPKGKSIDDVSKVTKKKVAGCEVVYFEVEGTYLDGPPMVPASKKTKRPDYRMIAVQFDGPKNVWHFKLIGPAKTVAKHKKEFDHWLESFK
jgi:hypothetical protein